MLIDPSHARPFLRPDRLVDIAAATFPIAMRVGTGALVQGYGLDFEEAAPGEERLLFNRYKSVPGGGGRGRKDGRSSIYGIIGNRPQKRPLHR